MATREEITVQTDHRAAIRTVMEETAATREEIITVETDHRAATRIVMEETAAIREEITVVRDHRAVIRTVTADHRAAAIRTVETDHRVASRTVGTDHRGLAIRTVETDHRAAIRTAMADHRAVSRTVTEIRAALAPVSEKIRIRTIQAEMAAETTAVHLETETTVHLLLIPRSRPSQAAPVRQTRTLIRMTVLTRETEKKTERRKHQRQERELSSCHSLRKKRLRLRMLRPLPFQSA